MGRFLNSKIPYADYCETVSEPFFVHKSELIKELIPAIGKKIGIFVLQGRGDLGKVLWRIW